MKKVSHIYDGKESFINKLNENKIDFYAPLLVRIVTAKSSRDNALALAKQIKEILPNGMIVGATSSVSVIHNGEAVDDATLIVVEQYTKLILSVRKLPFIDKNIETIAKQVHDISMEIGSTKTTINLLFSNKFWDGFKFVREFDKLTPQMKLAGGMAGEMSHFYGDSYLFDENGVYDEEMFIFAATAEEEYHFTQAFTPHDKLNDDIHEITKVDGHFIKEIDNEPAGDWMLNYLNLNKDNVAHYDFVTTQTDFDTTFEQLNNDYLTRFPLLLEHDGTGFYNSYDSKENSLSAYHANLMVKEKFKVGYVTPIAAMNATYELISATYSAPIELVFAYSCVVLRMYLSNVAKWALSPFEQFDVSGMFMMGELVYQNGRNEYHQGACVLQCIAESEVYAIPNLKTLEQIELVETDLDFILKAIEKQSQTTKSGAKYAEKLEKYRRGGSIESYYKDPDFNMPNMLQYRVDNDTFKMNKVCLVEIQTADATVAFAGQEAYNLSCVEMINEIGEIYKDNPVYKLSRMYAFNYKCIVISCLDYVSNMDFIEYCKELHKQYGYAKSRCHDITSVSRFVVVLNQENPVEEGMKYLFSNSDKMETFFISSTSSQDYDVSNEELRALDLLNRAIENKLVVPYYQGIHNNQTNKIDKYEALMRIIDLDDKVYSPYAFIDISQKYKLYTHISRLMIEQVLHDFKDRDEQVSINISVNDIESSTFREWFINALSNFNKPERVIVELLESDDFKQLDNFFEFVNEIKSLGCKIAIDDFGSGYSTFTTVMQLEPDYIKIDGSIVSQVANNSKSIMVLDTIQYLTKKLEAKAVAEFVENVDIQNILNKYEISYSQGYYFAKPVPFDELP